MCMVSMIGDEWRINIPKQVPYIYPYVHDKDKEISRPEFDKLVAANKNLKKEVDVLEIEMKALKRLLKAAKKYDEETGQANCEMDEKVALIKKIAELVGVDVSEIFEKKIVV